MNRTAVVDASDGGLMVGEFRLKFWSGYERRREFEFFGVGLRAIDVCDWTVVIDWMMLLETCFLQNYPSVHNCRGLSKKIGVNITLLIAKWYYREKNE
jgi:hypothetical protein